MKFADLVRYVFVLALLSVPIFYNLGELPIRAWDESRLAINAFEMFSNRQFMVLHFNGEPDLWNTKPPLMIWMQAISIHLFGLSEFSVRLPAALAGLFTCLALILLCHKYLGKFWLGVFAAFILITIDRYNGHHVIRTGDFDSLLILLMTLLAYSIFLFVQKDNSKYLWLSGCFMALAIATKGIAVMLMLPGLILYLAVKRRVVPMMKKPQFWYGAVLVLIAIGLFYGFRELLEPGYLEAVYNNEIGGRYFNVNEGHVGGLLYYVHILREEYWMYLMPVVLFTLFSKGGEEFRKITLFSLIAAISFLFFISVAKTKLFWYVAPVYPFLSLVLAIGLYQLFLLTRSYIKIDDRLANAVMILSIILVSFIPAKRIAVKNSDPQVYDYEEWLYEMSYYFRESKASGKDLSNYYFVREQYQPHIDFYIPYLSTRGVDINISRAEDLAAGDKVIYWEDPVGELLKSLYESEDLGDLGHTGQVREMRILSRNENLPPS